MDLWGLRVVAVDDDPDTLELVRTVLQLAGADLVAEASAGQALATVLGVVPDVVLIDVALPGTDGVALMRQIRRFPADRGGRVPAATLSACLPTPQNLKEWRCAGFQAHVAKPFDPGALLQVVTALAGLTVERRQCPLPRQQWPQGVERNRRRFSMVPFLPPNPPSLQREALR